MTTTDIAIRDGVAYVTFTETPERGFLAMLLGRPAPVPTRTTYMGELFSEVRRDYCMTWLDASGSEVPTATHNRCNKVLREFQARKKLFGDTLA